VDAVDLAGLEHENLVATLALVGANVNGAVVRRNGGVALVATGLPLRIFNHILTPPSIGEPTG
jgi:hypothetical protein